MARYTGQRDDTHSGQDGTGWCKISSHYSECAQFKTYELFISGIFHLIFSDHGRCWVTETAESETADKGDYNINNDCL